MLPIIFGVIGFLLFRNFFGLILFAILGLIIQSKVS